MIPKCNPEGRIFLSAPSNHDRFFFLHTFSSPAFDFNVEVAISKSRSYTLASAILKIDVVCDVAMMSTPNVLTTELRDLLYNECIDNMCYYSLLYPAPKKWRGIMLYPLNRLSVRPSIRQRFVSRLLT